ncbi:AAA family ATPase [Pseudomonas viridiflava]|uniref:AAA family ATPase n=1 Tax=Pseudomonas viridiflava TaxID=33069 RepID=UPI001BD117D1|nr:AAA family ATPase [Pseudomonas viridiflava]QVI85621.1 AAA family ATPase [Pseudomonas viridiflava]
MSNGLAIFSDLDAVATQLREKLEEKKYILLFAYNGTGKTRLSMEFKNLGKNDDARDTLYFNAYTEDLFYWDNDLENDERRVMRLNRDSRFFGGLQALEMENRIGPLLARYTDFNFFINYHEWEITFFREQDENGDPIPIKVSRGEENIFIWCFFFAVAQLAIDGQEAYDWVKYIYIDDPISSLDDNNAIAVACHLAYLLKDSNGKIKAVISSHHALFFNVMWNSLNDRKGNSLHPYFLSRNKDSRTYTLRYTNETPFFHHVALLQQLYEAVETDRLYTYHFNVLRSILEKTATFHGFKNFSACVKQGADDEDGILHARLINVLSHGDYSLFEPREMLEENKQYFIRILNEFMANYRFNPELFQEFTEEATV